MSKETHSLTRRQFLKGTAYASALSIGGLPSLASASLPTPKQDKLRSSNLSSESGLLAITVTNQSDKTVALNPHQPVSLEKVNGWVVVNVNKAPQLNSAEVIPGQQMNLAAGQQCSFVVDAELAPSLAATRTDIVITNEYSALDNMVPITPFTSMAA